MIDWNKDYLTIVLGPYYHLCQKELSNYFFDSLIANAIALGVAGKCGAIAAATKLVRLRNSSVPNFDGSVEDFYLAIMQQLNRRYGPEIVSIVRAGLSRNDVDMTVFRGYIRDRGCNFLAQLNALRHSLLSLAHKHKTTLIVAYTHHQPAQPTSLGHYLSGVEALLARDFQRIYQAITVINHCPLGASALAGTPYQIDRRLLAKLLGFEAPVMHSYDAIASGDWALGLSSSLAILGTSLSRFIDSLISIVAKGGLKITDSLIQKSSLMPQKRNPVVLEHCRALSAELLAGVTPVQLLNFNTPFGDVNDHSTNVVKPLIRQLNNAEKVVRLLHITLEESQFIPEALVKELEDRSVLSSELADYLMLFGHCELEEAHTRVRTLLESLASKGRTLSQIKQEDVVEYLGIEKSKVMEALDPRQFLNRRQALGGVAPKAQGDYLLKAQELLAKDIQRLQTLVDRVRTAHARLSKPSKALGNA